MRFLRVAGQERAANFSDGRLGIKADAKRKRERESEREKLVKETLRLLSREKICRITKLCQLRARRNPLKPAATREIRVGGTP